MSGLTSLTSLDLSRNLITDITALSGLTSLSVLNLSHNSITDFQPLLGNAGLGTGDHVNLLYNPIVSCAVVAALEAKGVLVSSVCP